MSQMENSLCNLTTDITYKKTSHPRRKEDGQGWAETDVNDTLNAFDNGEIRTPTLICSVSTPSAYVIDQGGGKSAVDILEDKSPTLCTTHYGTPAVLSVENHPNDSRMKIREDGTVQTLSSRMGTGGNNVPMVLEPVLLESNQDHATIQTDGVSTTLPASMGMGGGYVPMVMDMLNLNPKTDDVCQTLNAFAGTGGNNMPLVMETYQDTTGTLCASGYDKLGTQEANNDMYVVQSSWDGTQVAPTLTQNNAGGSQRMPDKDNFNAVITTSHGGFMTNADSSGVGHTLQATDHKDPQLVCAEPKSIVRRLTPVECERLQGYPDGWTDIGDWTGTDGKYHKESSDSSRYKALGNSICLPFWSWMAGRMVEVLKEEGIEKPTMASLFDGIGGFPLVFSQHGVTPVWASEIEEFPIAVTKRRFPDAEEGQLQAEQDANKL